MPAMEELEEHNIRFPLVVYAQNLTEERIPAMLFSKAYIGNVSRLNQFASAFCGEKRLMKADLLLDRPTLR